MRWAAHVACLGAGRGEFRVSVRRRDGKSSLARTRRRWKDNIKIDLQEVGWGRRGLD